MSKKSKNRIPKKDNQPKIKTDTDKEIEKFLSELSIDTLDYISLLSCELSNNCISNNISENELDEIFNISQYELDEIFKNVKLI